MPFTRTSRLAMPRAMIFAAARMVVAVFFLLIQWVNVARAEEPLWRATLSAETHIGALQEDLFLGTSLQIDQRLFLPQLGASWLPDDSPNARTSLRLLVQAPLRLRVLDRAPQQPGLLREEDWDQPRDLFRVVRRLDYGEPGTPFVLRLGELNGVTLLDGSALAHYFNVVNPDHPASGVLLSSHARAYDASFLLDDVLSPGVTAAAVLVRPAVLLDRSPLLQRLGVGAQLVADVQAPTQLARDDSGFVEVDATSSPTILDSQATFIGGPTLEVWLLARDRISLAASGHVLWHARLGRGEHAGLSLQWYAAHWMRAQLKSAVILAHDRYVPRYISPLYQVERYQTQGLGASLPAPKLRVVANDLAPRQDLYIDSSILLELPTLESSLLVSYLHARETPDADQLTLIATTKPVDELVTLTLFYHQNLFEDFSRSISLTRSLVGSELRVAPWGPLYVVGRYDRLFRLRDDGRWSSLQNWNVGIGAQWAFEASPR